MEWATEAEADLENSQGGGVWFNWHGRILNLTIIPRPSCPLLMLQLIDGSIKEHKLIIRKLSKDGWIKRRGWGVGIGSCIHPHSNSRSAPTKSQK